MKPRHLLLLAIALVLTPVLDAASAPAGTALHAVGDPVTSPSGNARATTLADYKPQRPRGGAFSEEWTYTLLLNDGMQARFSIRRADLGSLLGRVSGAELAVSGFDGKTYRAPKQFDSSNLRFDAGAKRLRVRDEIYFEGVPSDGRQRLRFRGGKDGVVYEADLTVTDIAPGVTWGNGVFGVSGQEMGLFIHVPHARVSGTLSVGGVTKRVSGTAYMDHTFQTDFAPKLLQTAVRYVQHSGTPEAGYFAVPAGGRGVVGFGVVREGGRYILRKPSSLQVVQTRRVLGAAAPHQLLVRYEGGAQTILNRSRDQQAFTAFEDLGGLSKTFAKGYVGGEPVVLRGYGTTNRRQRFAYEYVVVR